MTTPHTGPEGRATNPKAVDTISKLHTRTVDALKGFETMVEKAEPEFRPVAVQFRDLHDRQAAQMAQILTAMGGKVDADGSIMATVNRTVVSMRALFDEIDDDVMDAIRNGEEKILEAFDAALAEDQPHQAQRALMDMREDLHALLTATRHLD